MGQSKRKVKKILINKDFQLKILGIFGALFVVTSLCYWASIYLFFNKFITLGMKIGLPENHVFFNFINQQKSSLYMFFGGTFFVSMSMFMYVGLKLSHKVAGPLYRLNMHLTEISQNGGELKEIKFREKDFFLEVQDSFNKVVDEQKKQQNDHQKAS